MRIDVSRHGTIVSNQPNKRRSVTTATVHRSNGSRSILSRVELNALLVALADDLQCVHGVISLMEGEDEPKI